MSRGLGQRQFDTEMMLWFHAVKPAIAALNDGREVTVEESSRTPFQLATLVNQHRSAVAGEPTDFWKNAPTESQMRSTRRALLRLQEIGHVERAKHGRYTLSAKAVEMFTIYQMVNEERALA